MNNDWYLKRGDQQTGPLTAAEVRQLAKQNQLSPHDLIRPGNRSKWVKAQQVKGLFDAPAHSPQPATQQQQNDATTNVENDPIRLPQGLENGLVLGGIVGAVAYVLLSILTDIAGMPLWLIVASCVITGERGILYSLLQKYGPTVRNAFQRTTNSRKVEHSAPHSANHSDLRNSDRRQANRKGRQRPNSRQNKPHPLAKTLKARFRHPLFTGLSLGILVSIVLSTLKPRIGMSGLVSTLQYTSIGGLTIFAVLIVAGFLATTMSPQGTSLNTEFLRLSRRFSKAGICFSLVFGSLVWIESFRTERGVVAELTSLSVKKIEAEIAEVEQVEENLREEKKREAWNDVDFVLVSPSQFAVAIERHGENHYQIVQKESAEATNTILKKAWDQHIPIIGNEPNLTRQIYRDAKPGAILKRESRSKLIRLLAPQTFLPPEASLVSFYDTRLQTQRVGHRNPFEGEGLTEEFEFIELLPKVSTRYSRHQPDIERFRTETITSNRIDTSTVSIDFGDRELKESTSFLDYCCYNALRVLNNLTDAERPPHLYIDVLADVDQREVGLNAVKSERSGVFASLSEELQQSYARRQRPRVRLGFLELELPDREQSRRAGKTEDMYREKLAFLNSEIDRMRGLISQENYTASEIRSRLVQSGVKVIDRSERAREVMLTKVSGSNWLRPDSTEALATDLVTASHILLTEIRSSSTSERLVISMRIVDVQTGLILWEDQGEHVDQMTRTPSMITENLEVPEVQATSVSNVR